MHGLRQLFSVLANWTGTVPNSGKRIVLVTVAGAIAGFGSTALIWVINEALSGTVSSRTVYSFVALCLIIPVSGFIAQTSLYRLTAHATEEMRLHMARRILASPYRALEEMGVPKIMATMTEDVPAVISALANVPVLLTHTAVILGCLVYLGWLSWPLLLLMLGYMVVGVTSYELLLFRSVHYFRFVREQWDTFFKGIQALTHGNKELKLHRDRREEFITCEFAPAVNSMRRYSVQANTFTAMAVNMAQILFFVFIGMMIFLTPLFLRVSRPALTGYTITVLFMITPLTIILNQLSSFGQALVAADKVQKLGLSLDSMAVEGEASGPVSSWKKLSLVDVVVHLSTKEKDGETFRLGPLNLSFDPGELIFLVGGNGSGKTTLGKLLAGLYEPEQGELRMDGKIIDSGNRDLYRQNFSAIFSDFFLFDRLLGLGGPELEARAAEYLASLQLNHKVRIENNKLSTLDLSQGQRKRLALLVAFLEDRPIYVFDEWASDQDPIFKNVFYHQILPNLKARGKTVIVISHDDRYYHIADRLIKLESGQLEYDRHAPLPAFESKAAPVI
jgi:putative pyoverdin transport system ATP-binding/permease protein